MFHWIFKNRIIWNLINYKNYQFEPNNANEIAKYILDKKLRVDFSTAQLRSFMSRIAVNLTKVKLMNLYFSKLNKDEVEAILKNELKYYEKLIIDKNKPVYHYHIELEKLIRNLISIGYNISYKIENNKIVISPTNR